MKYLSLFVVSVLVLGLLLSTIVILKYENGNAEIRSAMENHIPNIMMPAFKTGWTGKMMSVAFLLANLLIIFSFKGKPPRQ